MRGPSVLLRCSMLDQQVGGWSWNIQVIFRLGTHGSPAAVFGVLLLTVNHGRQKIKRKCNALMNRKESSDSTATGSLYSLAGCKEPPSFPPRYLIKQNRCGVLLLT